jgi:hypothetical protein
MHGRMHKTMTGKFLSLFLAFAMLFSTFTVSVSALDDSSGAEGTADDTNVSAGTDITDTTGTIEKSVSSWNELKTALESIENNQTVIIKLTQDIETN